MNCGLSHLGKDDVWKRFWCPSAGGDGGVHPRLGMLASRTLIRRQSVFIEKPGCCPRSAPLKLPNGTMKEKLTVLIDTIKARFQKGNSNEPPIRDKMEKSIAHKLMWSAVVDFEDPSITRPELLKQFEVILQKYPHTEHRERAEATAEILKRMIAEDQAHAELGPKDLAQLPVEGQVRELIFRLRDQNGHQYSQPGWCDIFEDWHGVTNTPADRLLRLGYYAAVLGFSSRHSIHAQLWEAFLRGSVRAEPSRFSTPASSSTDGFVKSARPVSLKGRSWCRSSCCANFSSWPTAPMR